MSPYPTKMEVWILKIFPGTWDRKLHIETFDVPPWTLSHRWVSAARCALKPSPILIHRQMIPSYIKLKKIISKPWNSRKPSQIRISLQLEPVYRRSIHFPPLPYHTLHETNHAEKSLFCHPFIAIHSWQFG